VHKLKPDKSDGYAGLSSDYFLQACNELFVHISLLFSRTVFDQNCTVTVTEDIKLCTS